MLRKFRVTMLCLTLLVSPLSAFAQSPAGADPDIQTKIRKEGMDNSQIMRVMHYFTDVYGPRLTGSPNHEAAAKYAIKTMGEWGFANAHLEPWDFGHSGWLNERASGYVLSPFKDSLVFEVLAWTPSTKGTITGQAYQMTPPASPTEDEFKAFLDSEKQKVKGKIVFVGKHVVIPISMQPENKRMTDEQAKSRFSGGNVAGGGPPNARRQQQPEQQPGQPRKLTAREVNQRTGEFLASNGAQMMVVDTANEGRMEQRRVRAFNNRNFDPAKFPPTAVLSNEDYGRITRVLADGTPVQLEFNIVNHDYPEGKTSYNSVAEVPGTDKKDEVIMLGGHLDSWHSATGATDNAIGCATMMEAARIINALVKSGAIMTPREPSASRCGAAKNKGCWVRRLTSESISVRRKIKPDFANSADVFRRSGRPASKWYERFLRDDVNIKAARLGCLKTWAFTGSAYHAAARLADRTTLRSIGWSARHAGYGTDPIGHFNVTWHTNLDTYERIIEDDAKRSAIVIAAAIYHLAMSDNLLPRFAADQMPALPPARP